MKRECGTRPWADGRLRVKGILFQSLASLLALFVLSLFLYGCAVDDRRSIPFGAQETIDRVTEDIAARRDDKVYEEAAQEWRDAVGAEESRKRLEQVRERLGRVGGRTLHSGREQQNASAPLSGHALELVYQTTFERGDGVEQFTLLEREGRWLLARYSVSSDALK